VNNNFKMKKITKVIAVLFFASLMLACSSDDENNSGTDANLVGTWSLEAQFLNGEDRNINECQMNENVKFEPNGTASYTYYTHFLANCNIDVIETGSWVKNGNNLTITWDDADAGLVVYNLNILELSNTTLRWSTSLGSEGTLEETYNRN